MNLRNLWEEYILRLASAEALASLEFKINGKWYAPHSDNQVRSADGEVLDLFEPGIVITQIQSTGAEISK